ESRMGGRYRVRGCSFVGAWALVRLLERLHRGVHVVGDAGIPGGCVSEGNLDRGLPGISRAYFYRGRCGDNIRKIFSERRLIAVLEEKFQVNDLGVFLTQFDEPLGRQVEE